MFQPARRFELKRRWILPCLAAVTLVLVSATLLAQQKPHEGPPRPKPKFLLKDFAWMAGRWTGTIDKNIADVTYTGPDSGIISGIRVVHRDERIYMVELSSFVQTIDGVTLYMRHFSSELQAWEKLNPIAMKLVSYDGTTAEFDNSVSNDPKRSLITRNPDGSFTAHSDVYDEKGQHQVIELTYTRVK